MVKSNPVQLLRESHTRALFVPEKSPFGAKMRVLQGTYKCVPRSDESVSRVQGTHLNRNNWKKNLVLDHLRYFRNKLTLVRSSANIERYFRNTLTLLIFWANIEWFSSLWDALIPKDLASSPCPRNWNSFVLLQMKSLLFQCNSTAHFTILLSEGIALRKSAIQHPIKSNRWGWSFFPFGWLPFTMKFEIEND